MCDNLFKKKGKKKAVLFHQRSFFVQEDDPGFILKRRDRAHFISRRNYMFNYKFVHLVMYN